MVLVPGGQFWMGSSENDVDRAIEDCKTQQKKDEQTCKGWMAPEQPRHSVTLDPFYLDTYEVTNRLFDKFVRATGYQTTAEKDGTAFAWIDGKGWQDTSGATWRQPEAGPLVFATDRAHHPVVAVSWHDAEAYCRWAGKRLPTEAEFEYATRGGTQTKYWWGSGSPGTRRVANVADESAKRTLAMWPIMVGYDDGYGKTAPVGSYEANPFGLFDLTGNVNEWTADWFDGNYYRNSPERNPTGPTSGQSKVLRGGSWTHGPVRIRSANRNWYTPSTRDADVGFRCAQDAPK
jgi:formylglycine-generating enzyme required for sulfatase activity